MPEVPAIMSIFFLTFNESKQIVCSLVMMRCNVPLTERLFACFCFHLFSLTDKMLQNFCLYLLSMSEREREIKKALKRTQIDTSRQTWGEHLVFFAVFIQ